MDHASVPPAAPPSLFPRTTPGAWQPDGHRRTTGPEPASGEPDMAPHPRAARPSATRPHTPPAAPDPATGALAGAGAALATQIRRRRPVSGTRAQHAHPARACAGPSVGPAAVVRDPPGPGGCPSPAPGTCLASGASRGRVRDPVRVRAQRSASHRQAAPRPAQPPPPPSPASPARC